MFSTKYSDPDRCHQIITSAQTTGRDIIGVAPNRSVLVARVCRATLASLSPRVAFVARAHHTAPHPRFSNYERYADSRATLQAVPTD